MATAVAPSGEAVPTDDADASAQPESTFKVSNETNRRVDFTTSAGERLVLSPLEERLCVPRAVVDKFALLRYPQMVTVEEIKPSLPIEFEATRPALGFVFLFAIVWGILSLFAAGREWWIAGWVVVAAALALALAIDVWHSRENESRDFLLGCLNWLRSKGGQTLYLWLSVLTGIILPAAAIVFAGDVVRLVESIAKGTAVDEHQAVLALIGRFMQLSLIALASLLPALLFFLFDRDHLRTLRNRFLRQVMRFDRTVATRQDVHAKYGDLMDEAYGEESTGQILPGRRSPVLVGTIILALGWTLTLLNGDDFIPHATAPAGERVAVAGFDRTLIVLFEPRHSAICFAFLGAYFFGLNAILRGYVRKDLRPKTYSTLAVRILVVVVLAWILDLWFGGKILFVIAFLAGIVPETALVLIRELARSRLPKLAGGRFAELDPEADPLTNLEGIDVYDRARLLDEGVTNVESLAHHDLVDLMLQTRIPVSRIVDWVDQAILYLHVVPRRAGGKEDDPKRVRALETLRRYGIRTATDLENALAAAEELPDGQRDAFFRLLDDEPDAGAVTPPRLPLIMTAIADEEWMPNLREWRAPASRALTPIEIAVP